MRPRSARESGQDEHSHEDVIYRYAAVPGARVRFTGLFIISRESGCRSSRAAEKKFRSRHRLFCSHHNDGREMVINGNINANNDDIIEFMT